MPPAQPRSEALRERKRAKVRKDVQVNALRLFREQGYEETTVQQIAEAAVISESTFYRYFPTKADVVFYDDLDPLLIEALRAQPPELRAVDAIRNSFKSVLATMPVEDKERQRELLTLILSVPDLRASMIDQLAGGIDLLASEIALRTGRPADDKVVRALSGAVIGASIAVMFAAADDPIADLATQLDEAICALSAGVDL